MESSFKERLKYFEVTLCEQDEDCDYSEEWTAVIDMKEFREVCFQGIPEDSGLHATAWKVLLGYLPADKTKWQATVLEQRLLYYNLVKDFLEKPGEEPPASDHPLNSTPGSKWATYIQDNNTLEQIDKDVRRTLPDFAFFQQRVPQNPLNPLSALPPPAPPAIVTPPPPPASLLSNGSSSNIDDILNDLDPLHQTDAKRRFSFGIMGRPRSGSNTSKKSLKINNNLTNANRSRSNSRSSTRSFSSGMMENGVDMIHSPRNIVRKLSSAFSKSSSSLSLSNSNTNKQRKQPHPVMLKPICPYIPNRRSLYKRIQQQQRRQQYVDPLKDVVKEADDDSNDVQDYHWEVIERILFMYAKLNPGIGYVQGMNELLAPIYYLFANDTSPGLAGQVHAEADTFFVFTTLMGDVRDHFVRSLDQDASTGIHATLFRMQQRLAWYDKPLWRDLQRKDIKEPYYAFRWITVLFTQEWDLPDVIRLWDSLLAERGMQATSLTSSNSHRFANGDMDHNRQPDTPFEFLLDFAVAMLVCIRQELLNGDFAENIKLLQNYPINDIQFVLNVANRIRETRLRLASVGQIVPGVNDMRHSGTFNSDWSDTSSISSNTSTASSRLQQRLRESTDIARASFDSFRRESRESMDDMFRRGVAVSGEHWKRASTGDMKRSISQRLGFVKTNVLSKARRSGSVRSTASESSSSLFPSQQQKHWLLANQFNNNNSSNSSNNSSDIAATSSSSLAIDQKSHHQHLRTSSANSSDTNNSSHNLIPHSRTDNRHQRAVSSSSHFSSSADGSISSRSSSNVINRFSQLMVSGFSASSVNSYQQQRSSSPRFQDPLTRSTDNASTINNNDTGSVMSSNNDDENEKLLFAKAAAARDEALYYRTSKTYKGCV